MKGLRSLFIGLVLASSAEVAAGALDPVSEVTLSRLFFNPSLGQAIRISFAASSPGSLTLLILDRDGFLVRKLVSNYSVEAGKVAFDWDGRDDRGEVVPDEAYSLKIDLARPGGIATYFPGNAPAEDVKIAANYYDRKTGVLSYAPPRPVRVHVQAGIARLKPDSQQREGPVLKTLANREPRPAGAVVEAWNGFDESGTFYVPDLPDFVMSIAATTLPESAILTYGNRATTFLDRAARRQGASLFTYTVEDHHHHRGLAALDDVAPALKTRLANATWSAAERTWSPSGKNLLVAVDLEGLSAAAFAREPASLMVFVGVKRVRDISSPKPGMTVSVPLAGLKPGIHVVAVNWVSRYGPVAVQSFRLAIPSREHIAALSAK